MKQKYQLSIWLGLKALRYLAGKTDTKLDNKVVDFVEDILLGGITDRSLKKVLSAIEKEEKPKG